MNKQQQTALNMARFIKSQSLTLLEKLDALDADEQAAMCERRKRLARTVLIFTEKSDQLSRATDRVPGFAGQSWICSIT
ncbi:putative RNA I modulator protein [Escherichia coli]|nr:putative RNA I modulator protein [Escherichia coli]